MFKKFLSVIISFILLFSAIGTFPVQISAGEAQITARGARSGKTGDCTWTLDDNGTLTISGSGRMKDYGPDHSREGAPWDTLTVKEAVIENGVTNIGKCAFFENDDLQSVSIGDSVETIGTCAFESCKALDGVTLPASVTMIGSNAFYKCYSLSDIIIPNSVTSIGDSAFSECSLKQITIPESVTAIGDSAFAICVELTRIMILNPTVVFGNLAFGYSEPSAENRAVIYGYSGSTAETYANENHFPFVSISTGDCAWKIENAVLTVFGNGAMADYHVTDHIPWKGFAFNEVIIEDGVTNIGNNAFSDCENVTKATIGNTVTTIGHAAFELCTGLTGIDIPDSVLTIGNNAFWNCNHLTDVNIPESVTVIGKYAFEDCDNLTSVTLSGSAAKIDDNAFTYCEKLSSVDLGSAVTVIGKEAFYDCPKLKSVIIPDSVNSIGDKAFGYYPGQNEYDKIDGFTIYGFKDSEAESYAVANDFIFIEINGEGHTCVIVPSKPAGYFHVGHTDGVKCSRCGEWLIEQQEIPMLEGEGVFCDTDGDGEITTVDATYIQRKISNIPIPFEMDDAKADADEDGFVTIMDSSCIQRWMCQLKSAANIGRLIG